MHFVRCSHRGWMALFIAIAARQSQAQVLDCDSISVSGYFPLYTYTQSLYCTEEFPSGYHTHNFNGVTYYMPNDLDEFYHGTYPNNPLTPAPPPITPSPNPPAPPPITPSPNPPAPPPAAPVPNPPYSPPQSSPITSSPAPPPSTPNLITPLLSLPQAPSLCNPQHTCKAEKQLTLNPCTWPQRHYLNRCMTSTPLCACERAINCGQCKPKCSPLDIHELRKIGYDLETINDVFCEVPECPPFEIPRCQTATFARVANECWEPQSFDDFNDCPRTCNMCLGLPTLAPTPAPTRGPSPPPTIHDKPKKTVDWLNRIFIGEISASLGLLLILCVLIYKKIERSKKKRRGKIKREKRTDYL